MSHGITRRREQRKERDKATRKQALADVKTARKESKRAEKAEGIAAEEALHTEAIGALKAFYVAIEAMEGIEKRLDEAAQALEDAGYDAEDFKLTKDGASDEAHEQTVADGGEPDKDPKPDQGDNQ